MHTAPNNSFFRERENIFSELINSYSSIGKGEAICTMNFYVGVWGMRGTKDSCNFIGIGEKNNRKCGSNDEF